MLLSLCTYICAFFIVKRTFPISAVQVIKIIQGPFPSLFFARLPAQNRLQSNLQKFQLANSSVWKYSKTSTQLVSNPKILPFKTFLLLINNIKSYLRGKAPSIFVTTSPVACCEIGPLALSSQLSNYTYPQH